MENDGILYAFLRYRCCSTRRRISSRGYPCMRMSIVRAIREVAAFVSVILRLRRVGKLPLTIKPIVHSQMGLFQVQHSPLFFKVPFLHSVLPRNHALAARDNGMQGPDRGAQQRDVGIGADRDMSPSGGKPEPHCGNGAKALPEAACNFLYSQQTPCGAAAEIRGHKPADTAVVSITGPLPLPSELIRIRSQRP